MSRGNDSRGSRGQGERGQRGGGRGTQARNARSSVPMTVERARAIQAHADRTGRNQDFKERAMSAAATNHTDDTDDDE